jgi:hypothetical protein
LLPISWNSSLMQHLNSEEMRVLDDVAGRHEVSLDAVVALFRALVEGNGRQAQFNHPDLGGMGQWSQGGMIMIGDMFNNGLKHRVDALCSELAALVRSPRTVNAEEGAAQSQSQGIGASWQASARGSSPWPAELGIPASTGAQNNMRYAYFPSLRRLAIQHGGMVRVYDSGDHDILGFSQQQSGDQSLTFTSQFGVVRVADLPLVLTQNDESREPVASASAAVLSRATSFSASEAAASASAAPPPHNPAHETADILAAIERLAELRQKNILTEDEFAAKKAELLSRI